MSINPRIGALKELGTSVWLDDLSTDLLESGAVDDFINETGVVGLTTNPSIFEKSITTSSTYDATIAKCAAAGENASEATFSLICKDVDEACEKFLPVWEASGGVDGRVSIEVEPGFAHDTANTVEQARALWKRLDRPNLLIKVPATAAGIPAIKQLISEGISVNATLIFSVECYEAVMNAYIEGLREAKDKGLDISKIVSVASVFVSRLDGVVDKQLTEVGTEEALALRGKAGIANSRLAYDVFVKAHAEGGKFDDLAAAGGHPQRLLWASTSVKNPDYPDTLYVVELAGPDTVNTIPQKTLKAMADHGEVKGDTLTGTGEEAAAVWQAIKNQGIDLNAVVQMLEDQGVASFIESWKNLVASVESRMKED